MIRRKRNSGRYLIKCSGLNVSNFINFCTINGMSINSINRTNDGYVELELDDKDLKILNKLDTSKYDLEVIRIGGVKRLLNTLIYRIGLVVGLAISIVAMCLLNNRLFRVHVYGLSSVSEEEVISSVEEYGIGMLSSLNFDTGELEKHLSQEFNFSLVSIITKGNSLIISVKEELPDISDTYAPITADYNMIITAISVYSGTCNVGVGDIIYKGDILVEPFIQDEQDIVYVTPCAEIKGKAYFSASYNFVSSEEVFVRTGQKKIIASEIYLGKWRLSTSNKDSNFTNFEVESYNNLVSKYFLPITIRKTFAYELEKKTITRDFEQEKDAVVNKLKNDTYALVPESLNADKEDIIITEVASGYIVNVYLECNVNLKYNYN